MRSGNSPSQIGYYVVVLMAKFIYVSRHISRYDTCTVWRIILIAISRPVIIVTIATRTWHGCILLWVHSVICDCQCVGRFIHCASQLSWRAKCTHESAYTLRFKKHSDFLAVISVGNCQILIVMVVMLLQSMNQNLTYFPASPRTSTLPSETRNADVTSIHSTFANKHKNTLTRSYTK